MAPPTKKKPDGSASQDEKTSTTALATQGTTAIAEADDFEDVAGQGFEENSAALQKIPFGNVLQSSSKLIKLPKNQRPAHLREAEPGMFYNANSDELIPLVPEDGGGLEFIPVYFRRLFTLWEKTDFRGKKEADDPAVKKALAEGEFGEWTLNGFELRETIELYVVYTSPVTGEVDACVISIQSTKITPFKDWNSKVTKFKLKGKDRFYNPPLFVNRTKLTAHFDPNGGKDAFFRVQFHPAEVDGSGTPDFKLSVVKRTDPRFIAAQKLHDDLVDMLVVADYSTAENAGSTPAEPKGERKPDKGF